MLIEESPIHHSSEPIIGTDEDMCTILPSREAPETEAYLAPLIEEEIAVTEAYKESEASENVAPLTLDESAALATAIRSVVKPFESLSRMGNNYWRDFDKEPLLPILAQKDLNVEPEPESIRKGDLILYHWDQWQLAMATGEHVGCKPLFYTGGEDARIPIFSDLDFRLAENVHVEEKPLQVEPLPAKRVNTGQYLRHATSGSEERTLRIQDANKNDRTYNLVDAKTYDDIEFVDEEATLASDYLLRGSNGIPIIVSDHHQKLAGHIGQLISLDILRNEKPWIDWIDEHPDDNMDRNGIRTFSHLHTMADIAQACRTIDCGQAASLLYMSNMANIRNFNHLSVISMPNWGSKINPFNYEKPFHRIDDSPHVLSFDLDQLSYFCSIKGSSGNYGLEDETTQSYFKWLRESGMSAQNYDAIFLYTSPGYCAPGFAQDAVKKMLTLF